MDLAEIERRADDFEQRLAAVERRARALAAIDQRSRVCSDAAAWNWGGRPAQKGNAE